jgi:hypothetical protein
LVLLLEADRMATPARSRIQMPETLTVEDQSDRLRLGARSLTIRVIEILDLVWRREPTMFIELGVLWTILVWAVTILMFGTGGYPPLIVDKLGRVPEVTLGVTGILIVSAQAIAVVCRNRSGRGYGSFVAAMWLGYLSFSILAGDYRLAGGWVYLGTAAAALLPFWRVVLDRRL